MGVEITFFQGISMVIFASISIPTAFYFQVARKLESRVEDITIEKAWIVEGDLIKCLLVSSVLCTKKMFKLISGEKAGEEAISKPFSEKKEIFSGNTFSPCGKI